MQRLLARSEAPALRTSLELLSRLCSWGVSAELDAAKAERFGMRRPPPNMSLAVTNRVPGASTVLFPDRAASGASWCVSSVLNAQRTLAILVLAQGVLQGDERKAVEVINFYVGRLPARIGRRFRPLSLEELARYWQTDNGNLQRAARTLVLSAVHRAPEKQRRAELFYWSSQLARRAPGAVDDEALRALAIVCTIAADFPALLPLTARSMAAAMLQSLVAAGRGVTVAARMVAIELLSRCFATFRPYVDCRLLLRRLMAAVASVSAPAADPDGATPPPPPLQPADPEAAADPEPDPDPDAGGVSFALVGLAKAALLRICAADVGLVAATICDMLQGDDARVGEQWQALQAVGLVAAKYPALLAAHLEAVAAAIVAAIDPKRASVRRRLIGAAGAALRVLVRAYPWAAFHPDTQCLVLGCADGRCVAFDLRTATRTAVFDSGARAVAAVAISPPGDRVASFALGSRALSVWDPAPSALAMFARSLFRPAAEGAEAPPAKTMPIPPGFLPDADDLPPSELMRLARLAWTGDSTVLLQIGDASFSLSV